MDLVDIDKVLDDLELNENQETSPIGPAGPNIEVRSKDISAGVISAEQVNNLTTACTPDERNKKFVAVSRVFSSLDDYRRDVESLGEEIKRLKSHKSNEELSQSGDNPSFDSTDIQVGNEVKVTSPPDDEDPTEEFQDEGDYLTSASSITTSSPSSFSSGPSPGSSTESCALISGPEGNKGEQGNSGARPKPNVQEECTKELGKPENSKNDPSVEVGLSSISSCLYNENTSSSIPGFSQDIRTDVISSISNYHEDLPSKQAASQLNYPVTVSKVEEDVPALPRATPNVVGFGSTMDEISDTELDSILQEIDSDSQAISGQVNSNESDHRVAESAGAFAGAILAVAEDIPTDPISTSAAELVSDSDAAVSQSKQTNNDDNLQNADSFSQASTIEFAELRLQTDFGTEPLADDRSTSSNSGMKADGHSDFLCTQPTASTSEETGDLGRSSPRGLSEESDPHAAETNSQFDGSITGTAAESAGPVLQRPNSLDLPIKTCTEVNINSTAGLTPPASRLDDASILSSSSSEGIPEPSASGSMTEMWKQPPQTQDTSLGDASGEAAGNSKLGKVPPFWIPDSEASACMQCKQKFSLIKRRHHCRACGQVLCSACCSQKAKLEFLGDSEVRVCVQCHLILNESNGAENKTVSQEAQSSAQGRFPNPNNPMEYCSVIPPHQQVSQTSQSPISVMVPVGVLKREGSSKNGRKDKTVIFSDGIRPGCDLTELDNSWDDNKTSVGTGFSGHRKVSRRDQTPPAPGSQRPNRSTKQLPTCDETNSYIPREANALPPIYVTSKGEHMYKEVQNNAQLIEKLHNETLKFAVQLNFYVFVKIVKLKCCINKTIINFTTLGMHHVGQDEIIILLELGNSEMLPKDIFVHLNEIYRDADKGFPVTELGFSLPKVQNFLGSKENGGFLYIRPTFQCLQEIHLPESPFLIGILIHRWEIPWAKNFPLRLMLRLGAQYRYYPSPHISVRGRDAVYGEISQTIINFLADFRNYAYTLATIKGMYIHMEDRRTNISIPKNRYDQVLKAVNNSSEHILAMGGNFSKKADGHLVCIQNMDSDCPETRTYSTQAINIQGQPRKVTGASFIVLNGALKTSSGLSGKCSIVEDGLMVQIPPNKMAAVRNALKNMKDVEIVCGPTDADESQTEVVTMKWTGNDLDFNLGVKSPIDSKSMDGIPSIRVHSGLNFSNANHTIRWTEVFIIQFDEEIVRGKDPIDTSKLSEQIAKSTSKALVSFLDLLAANGCLKIGLRVTLHQENVCYEAGSQNQKLAPLYMNALDNELIPTLHKQTTSLEIEKPIILELIFHILDK